MTTRVPAVVLGARLPLPTMTRNSPTRDEDCRHVGRRGRRRRKLRRRRRRRGRRPPLPPVLIAGVVTHVGMSLAASLPRRILNRRRSALRARIDEESFRNGRVEPRMGADGEWHETEPAMMTWTAWTMPTCPRSTWTTTRPRSRPRRKRPRPRPPHRRSPRPTRPRSSSCRRSICLPSRSRERKSTVTPPSSSRTPRTLEGVLDDFGVKGEIINVRPGPGRHPLRARARARHQVVARHRPRRRHRPLDVGDRLPRRRHPRQERHRHRVAQRQGARPYICASCSPTRTSSPTRPSSASASARTSAG